MTVPSTLAFLLLSAVALSVAACGAGTNLSADYCTRLPDGRWVTNDRARNRCVPDPADATGNAAADGAVPLPRCRSCKPSDWTRAERQAKARTLAARRVGAAARPASLSAARSAPEATAAANGTTSGWPAEARASFVNACTVTSRGRAGYCGCVADRLARSVSIDQLPGLTLADRRVYRAIATCVHR